MHGVFFDVIDLDRPEGPQSHVKGHKAGFYTHCPDLFEKSGGKMQTRCRRCRGALVFCVYGLVAVPVPELMGDVRGKRHLAQPVKDLLENPLKFKAHQAVSALGDLEDLRLQASVSKDSPGAGLKLLSGPDQAFPDVRPFPL